MCLTILNVNNSGSVVVGCVSNEMMLRTGPASWQCLLNNVLALVFGARFADAYALLKGHAGEQSHEPKAYTQCRIFTGFEGYTAQTIWV